MASFIRALASINLSNWSLVDWAANLVRDSNLPSSTNYSFSGEVAKSVVLVSGL